jgi:hypothetical protein
VIYANKFKAEALSAHERRQVTVHVVERRQTQESLAIKDLEPAAGVARPVPEEPRSYRVRQAGSPSLGSDILTLPPFAGDHHQIGRRITPRQGAPQFRDIGRIILTVAVEGGDHRRARRNDAGSNSAALTGIGAMGDNAQLPADFPFFEQAGPGSICRTIIDNDDFMGDAAQRGGNFTRKGDGPAFLIIHRNDDA